MARRVRARLDWPRRGKSWQARLGSAWHGMSSQGMASIGRHVPARMGTAGLVSANLGRPVAARLGKAWRGWVRQILAGMHRHGWASQGTAILGRRGTATPDRAWQVLAVLGGRGWAGLGGTGQVVARRFYFTHHKDSKMKISWRSGSRFPIEAEVAYEEIERIRKKHAGEARPEDIVAEARKQRNPLHKAFEWDDTIAANEYRLDTARTMLRSIVVQRPEISTDRPQRMYEVVRTQATSPADKSRKVYRTTDDIMKDEDLRAELLGRALRELISFRQRYRDLQELAVVLREIDEVVLKIEA